MCLVLFILSTLFVEIRNFAVIMEENWLVRWDDFRTLEYLGIDEEVFEKIRVSV